MADTTNEKKNDQQNTQPAQQTTGQQTVQNNTQATGQTTNTTQSTGTVPEGFTGSTTGVTAHKDWQEVVKDRMNQRSIRWWTHPEERAELEQANKDDAALLGGTLTLSNDGYWTGEAARDPQQLGGGGGNAYRGGGSSPGSNMKSYLEQWREAALAQNSGAIDYEVDRAVTALERALQDAQPQFKEQVEGIARDELQGLDNSALYAEARGDKGGIGQSQYNEIQATANQNRLMVQQAQTKLATDTARQIEDLRSQGEFEKADAALEISQTYLTKLIEIEQWAAEFQLSQQQFRESIRQWEAEYQLAMDQFLHGQELDYAQMTGKFSDGTSTLAASQYEREQLASMGAALLENGIMPNSSQLAAMGMEESQADAFLKGMQLESAVGRPSSPSPGRRTGWYENDGLSDELIADMQRKLGVTPDGKWDANTMEAAEGLTAQEYFDQVYRKLPHPISSYGSAYSSIWKRARDMYDPPQSKSKEEIRAFIDLFNEEELTELGLDAIMRSLGFV